MAEKDNKLVHKIRETYSGLYTSLSVFSIADPLRKKFQSAESILFSLNCILTVMRKLYSNLSFSKSPLQIFL